MHPRKRTAPCDAQHSTHSRFHDLPFHHLKRTRTWGWGTRAVLNILRENNSFVSFSHPSMQCSLLEPCGPGRRKGTADRRRDGDTHSQGVTGSMKDPLRAHLPRLSQLPVCTGWWQAQERLVSMPQHQQRTRFPTPVAKWNTFGSGLSRPSFRTILRSSHKTANWIQCPPSKDSHPSFPLTLAARYGVFLWAELCLPRLECTSTLLSLLLQNVAALKKRSAQS